MDWTILKTPDEVARVACQRILAAAEQAIEKRGAFNIVLAGGSTPEKTYELLSQESSNWKDWHIWFGDERCLPKNHPDRNSLMIEQVFTSKVPIPEEQVHIIPAEQENRCLMILQLIGLLWITIESPNLPCVAFHDSIAQ